MQEEFQVNGILFALIISIIATIVVGLALIALLTGRKSLGKTYSPALRGDIRTLEAKMIEIKAALERIERMHAEKPNPGPRFASLPQNRAVTRTNRPRIDYFPPPPREPDMPKPMTIIRELPDKKSRLEKAKSVDFTESVFA